MSRPYEALSMNIYAITFVTYFNVLLSENFAARTKKLIKCLEFDAGV
jgi:hypothetical protein